MRTWFFVAIAATSLSGCLSINPHQVELKATRERARELGAKLLVEDLEAIENSEIFSHDTDTLLECADQYLEGIRAKTALDAWIARRTDPRFPSDEWHFWIEAGGRVEAQDAPSTVQYLEQRMARCAQLCARVEGAAARFVRDAEIATRLKLECADVPDTIKRDLLFADLAHELEELRQNAELGHFILVKHGLLAWGAAYARASKLPLSPEEEMRLSQLGDGARALSEAHEQQLATVDAYESDDEVSRLRNRRRALREQISAVRAGMTVGRRIEPETLKILEREESEVWSRLARKLRKFGLVEHEL